MIVILCDRCGEEQVDRDGDFCDKCLKKISEDLVAEDTGIPYISGVDKEDNHTDG